MDLDFTVNNQTVTRSDRNSVVDFSADYLRLCFTFSTDWTGLTKYVFFRVNGKNYRFALSDDKLVVPNQFLECGERLVFGVYGTNDSERITTNLTVVRLQQSKYGDFVEIEDHVFEEDLLERIYSAIDGKVSISDIRDNLTSTDTDKPLSALQGKELKTLVDGKANVMHTHSKSEITDFSHTHTKSEITDFSHNHDERYYTEIEVNNLINELKHDLQNGISFRTEKKIIQKDDSIDLTAHVLENGVPVAGKTVNFYVEED